VRILAVRWLAIFLASFVVLQVTEPSGEGFARGLNRIAAFLTWQGIALAVAIAGAFLTRGAVPDLRERLKPLGYWPLVASLVVVVTIVGMIAFRVLVQPELPG
jgi:hypothetical protein